MRCGKGPKIYSFGEERNGWWLISYQGTLAQFAKHRLRAIVAQDREARQDGRWVRMFQKLHQYRPVRGGTRPKQRFRWVARR